MNHSVPGGGRGYILFISCFRPDGRQCPIGIIPGGTGNNFYRITGIGKQTLKNAVDMIVAGKVRAVDSGRLTNAAGETYSSVNLMSFGMFVQIHADQEKLRFLGKSRYHMGGVMAVFANNKRPCRLSVDDGPVTAL